MDMMDGIIVGAAAAAIGAVLADRLINHGSHGGGRPNQTAVAGTPQYGRPQPLIVYDQIGYPTDWAPVVQETTPITEAPYNQQPHPFVSAFGPSVNQPNEEAVLPY